MSQRSSGLLPPVVVALETPSVARVYDYYLGGSTNWEVDRTFGDQVLDQFPIVRRIAFAHRLFLNRVVGHLMRRGINQFLDIGAGMPSSGATHEAADNWAIHAHQRPYARVVYVDHDPLAAAYGQLLLAEEGDRRRHAMIEADLRAPEDLWAQALDTDLLDRNQPVGLLLVGLLHLEQRDACGNEVGTSSVAKLCQLMPFGSYAAVSHVTDDGVPVAVARTLTGLKRLYDQTGAPVSWRSRAQVQALLGDWRDVAPGWTSAVDWHPEDTGPHAPHIALPAASKAVIWAGVARKA
ncbi:SAM-dependent methyltransferase [Actinophytocola sediminis]